MSDRKNLFLIGRRSNDEDQLTEMLAGLWQFEPELPSLWLASLGLDVHEVDSWDFETQYTIPSGARPDIALWSEQQVFVLVESKLDAGLTKPRRLATRSFLESVKRLCARSYLSRSGTNRGRMRQRAWLHP
jgi:hypothetical protein